MTKTLLPLTAAPVEERRLFGRSSRYRTWYEAILDGKVPAEQCNGRWYLTSETIATSAPLLHAAAKSHAA